MSSVSSTMNNEILNKKNADGIPQQQDQLETTIFVPVPSHPLLWFTFLAVLANHMEYVSFMFVMPNKSPMELVMTVESLIIVVGRQLLGGDQFSSVNLGDVGMALLVAMMH